MQTSADSIYIFKSAGHNTDAEILQWHGRDWPIERGILRPCLLDVTVEPYSKPEANSWMIYPYELIAGNGQPRARLIQPAELASRFPMCWEYLQARRPELEQRSVIGGRASERQWYQFGRSQSLTKFDGSKIILPILSLNARYSYDDTNVMVTGGGNGPYYMVRPRPESPVSSHYLMAVLHHPVSEAMVRTNTSVFRGGYYSHGKQFIEDIPIPVPTEAELSAIERVVAELVGTLDAVKASRTPHDHAFRVRHAKELQSQVKDHISARFEVTADDMAVVRAVPLP